MSSTEAARSHQARCRMLLAHEWISSIGGSENVFRELMSLFPYADAACLWNDVPATFPRHVMESVLGATPLRGRKALTLPLMPATWHRVSLDEYDTVLASSHAFSHHLAARAARYGLHAFSYVYTPARYLWAPEVEPRGRSAAARIAGVPLRRIDRRAVDPRVRYGAISEFIRSRIRAAWDVDATVIYPPVDVERIRSVDRWRDHLTSAEAAIFQRLPVGGFVLGASRLVSYKRLDRVIEVGEQLDLPVVIAGAGPDREMLEARASSARVPVHFTGRVTDAQLFALYQEALLFVFLAIEDFGIMPVEAMAAGTPVLVSREGGAVESVEHVGGGTATDVTAPAHELASAARDAMAIDLAPAPDRLNSFSRAAFADNIRAWLDPAA